MRNALLFILAFSILILPYGCAISKSISIQQIPEYSKKRNFLQLRLPKQTTMNLIIINGLMNI